jgi:hypothetical protein
MAKDQGPMRDDLTPTKALVDKKTVAALDEWARMEGRSLQSHNGILLRRLARLYRESPEKLEQLGMLAPGTHPSAAVA